MPRLLLVLSLLLLPFSTHARLVENGQAPGVWHEFQGNAAFLMGDYGLAKQHYENAKPPSCMQLSTSIALTGHSDMHVPQPLHRACSSIGMAALPACRRN